ncbi:MAG: glycoside hydrolase family 2 protein [Rubellimicrobium sp.]|nr:glycoside hydrolase family 2 protein [Rubellimicrobium sp.]
MTPTLATVDLSGRWDLRDASGEHACAVTFPGDGITALHEAGLIPDPYAGRNEYGLRWIAERDWTARRVVPLGRTDVELVAEGLDCVCTVRVNGQVVLSTRNAFRRFRADLSGAARVGENLVEITFHSATRAAEDAQAAQPFVVPYAAQNCPIPNGNMLRKPACDFGWDWNIALAPFGVTGALRIEPVGPRIDDILVHQTHLPDRIEVALTIRTANIADGTLLSVSLCGETVAAPVAAGRACPTLTLRGADLWWPAGLGAQVLHELRVTGAGATATRRIGLRELTLVTEPDAAGLGFRFRCNGRDVFARGANWIPADALAGRISAGRTRDLLQSAADAHMNMIRVWGGGRYEPDSFHDACDELGLMVWQDFMFACNLYPSTPDFLSEVQAEVRDNVARLQHHASLALWCGDNELIGALDWFPESRADRDRYLVSYDRLNRAIETALHETDPAANWWPSSPSPGPLNFRDAWHEDGSGDMHFWSVWHEGRDFDHYREVSPRFCSEFGFQSYPSMAVIERFAAPAERNIASPVFESHQKNAGGNARIAETMFRYFRWPERFADFVWLSQVQQALAMKTAVTHWRSLKPHCMGTLYWQLNDTWPVCSWSSLDHGGGWKVLHHMARRFYAPVIVTAVPDAGALALRAVNDTSGPVTLTIAWHAARLSGETRPLGTAGLTIGTEAATPVATLPPGTLGPDEILAFTWQGGGHSGGDIHAPLPWKAYDLVDPGLALTATRDGACWRIGLSARALALFATVSADVPGRFSANALTLFPGHPAGITFTPDDPAAIPAFTLQDLWSATMAPR